MLWLSRNEKIHWWGGVDPIDGWGEGGKKDEDKGYKEYKRPRVKKNGFLYNKQNSNKHVMRYLDVESKPLLDVKSRMILPQFYLILSSSLYLFT